MFQWPACDCTLPHGLSRRDPACCKLDLTHLQKDENISKSQNHTFGQLLNCVIGPRMVFTNIFTWLLHALASSRHFYVIYVVGAQRCQTGDSRLTTSWSGEEGDVIAVVIEVHGVAPVHLLHVATCFQPGTRCPSNLQSWLFHSLLDNCSHSLSTGEKLSLWHLWHNPLVSSEKSTWSFRMESTHPQHVWPHAGLKVYLIKDIYLNLEQLSDPCSKLPPAISQSAHPLTAAVSHWPGLESKGAPCLVWYRLAAAAAIDF